MFNQSVIVNLDHFPNATCFIFEKPDAKLSIFAILKYDPVTIILSRFQNRQRHTSKSKHSRLLRRPLRQLSSIELS